VEFPWDAGVLRVARPNRGARGFVVSGQAKRAFEEVPETGKRTFYHNNVLWIVGERPARAMDIKRTPHLVFESDDCIRRVRNFPTNWRELDTTQLYELSWRI
jgi:hypothetical protein